MKPQRIQLSRRKGWRMPPNTVKVDRATKWGNPFRPLPMMGLPGLDYASAVDKFRAWLSGKNVGGAIKRAADCYPDPHELRGKNLACWCPLNRRCHADILLELANPEAR